MAKGLGKGINALFSGLDAQADDSIQEVAIHELRPNPINHVKRLIKKQLMS